MGSNSSYFRFSAVAVVFFLVFFIHAANAATVSISHPANNTGYTDYTPDLNFTYTVDGYCSYYTDDDLEDGLVGHWAFEETLNNTHATDFSSQSNTGIWSGYTNNDGTLYNSPTWTTISNYSSRGNNALDFNSADSEYIDAGNDSSLNPTGAITISAWIKTPNDGNYKKAVTKLTANRDDGYWFQVTSSGTVNGLIKNSGTVILNPTSTGTVYDNTWHHIAFTYDNSTGNAYTYIDGSQDGSDSDASNRPIGVTTNNLYISSEKGTQQFFNGTIDEVRIWNKALNQSEIEQEMNSHIPIHGSGLVSSWSFEKGSGSTAFDTNNYVKGDYRAGGRFDGSGDIIDLGDNSVLDIEHNMTISAWVYPASTTFLGTIIRNWDWSTTNYGWAFDIDNGQMRVTLSEDGTADDFDQSVGTVTANEWQFVAFSYDNPEDEVTFYHNGINVSTKTATITDIYQPSTIKTIGGWCKGNNITDCYTFFNGTIDEVQIYNRALSLTEIEKLYNSTRDNFIVENDTTNSKPLSFSTSDWHNATVDCHSETVDSTQHIFGTTDSPSLTLITQANNSITKDTNITLSVTYTDANDESGNVSFYSRTPGWNISTASYIQSTSTQDAEPVGIFFKPDGTKMYEIGWYNSNIYESTLSTAWNISTASYVQKINSQDNSPSGIFFKSDGTKMYEIDNLQEDIYESTLSTAWNISTASYVQKINSQDNSPSGIFFKSDGTKMYEIGDSSNSIYEYTLSTAWNISTASYIQNINSQDTKPTGIFFKSDGTKMYEIGFGGDNIYESTLSTAWNISTASYVQNISTQDSFPRGIFFKPDGTKMYETGDGGDKIYEYSLPTLLNKNIYISNGSNVNYAWSGLTTERLYEWYATATDGIVTYTGPLWNFLHANMTNCSDVGFTSLRFDMYDETDFSDITNTSSDIDIWFTNVTATGRTGSIEGSLESTADDSHDFCIEPSGYNYVADANLIYGGGNYGNRIYYLASAALNSTTENVILYMIPDNETIEVTFTVRDHDLTYMEGVYVDIQRKDLAAGTYRTMTTAQTDSNGKFTAKIASGSEIQYKFIVKDTDGSTVLDTISPVTFSPSTTAYTITVDEKTFKLYDDVSYNCTYVNASTQFVCDVVDSSGLMTESRLVVDRKITHTWNNICDSTETTSSATHVCNIPDTSDEYRYELYVVDDTERVDTGYIDLGITETDTYGLTGVFLTMLIILTIGTIGIFHPAFSAIGGSIAIAVSYVAGLIALSPASVVGIVCVAGIITIRMMMGDRK